MFNESQLLFCHSVLPAPDLEKMVASCMADVPSDAEDGDDDDDPDLLDELAELGSEDEEQVKNRVCFAFKIKD